MKTLLAMIKGHPLKYRVRKHPRARRRTVRVSRDTGVVVTLPVRDRLDSARELLEAHADWLMEMVEEEGVWDGPVVPAYATGSMILLHGTPRTLRLVPRDGARARSRLDVTEGELVLTLPANKVLDPGDVLRRNMKKLAGEFLRERVDHWAEKTGLQPAKVIVGERRSRWGSCTAGGTVSLCYRLVMAPPAVADSVVIHELCHLRHLDHSPRFYTLLKTHVPDYQDHKAWLARFGSELLL